MGALWPAASSWATKALMTRASQAMKREDNLIVGGGILPSATHKSNVGLLTAKMGFIESLAEPITSLGQR